MKFPKQIIAWANRTIQRSRQPLWDRRVRISPCKKYILKRRGTIIGEPPTLAIPTLEIEQYILQPKADRRGKLASKAFRELSEKYGSDDNIVGCDFHDGNVGYWRGKPVVFDW